VNTPKAQALTHRLANLAKQQGVQYQFTFTIFLIQQLLLRLAKDEVLSRYLTFNGGFIMLRLYHSPRYTIDLDASISGILLDQIAPLVTQVAEKEEDDGTWYRFEKAIDLEAQGEYGGLRFVFRGGIGEVINPLSKARIINLDLGIGNAANGVLSEVPLLLSDESCCCNVYPEELIVAEKLHSLTTRSIGNSRSKDIFDISHLAGKLSLEKLQRALKDTFGVRGDALPKDLFDHFQSMDTSVLRRGWNSAVASVADSKSFDDSWEDILALIKRI